MITNIYSYKFNNSFYTSFASINTSCVDKKEIEQEEKRLIEYYFHNLPTTEKMSRKNCDNLKNNLSKSSNMKDFLMVSTGVKPASLITADNCCKVDEIGLSEDFDILKVNDSYNHVFIFNKKETLKNIRNNKEFLTQRMDLLPFTEDEAIYDILISDDSPLKTKINNFKNVHDLVGVILGFPVKESIMFQLEDMANLEYSEKQDIHLLKTVLKKVFSTSGLYSNFDKRYQNKIMQDIDSVVKREISNDGITYTEYFNEPEGSSISRLVEYKKELEKINSLGLQRDIHCSNSVSSGGISDDYYNHLLMFELD